MTLRRWRDSLAPPLLAAAAIAAVVIPASASPARTRLHDRLAARADAAPIARPIAACKAAAGGGSRAGTSWYRLDPALDADGALTGWRLVAGRAAERVSLDLSLPVESFASGPRDGLVLVGADDGRRSLIRLVDIGRRCATVLHDGPELVRRAVLTPESDAIVEFRLDRRTRADLGVWLRPLDGSKPRRIVDPLAPNRRLGLVFSTQLAWSADGNRLAITSCGESACLTRLYDRRSGRVAMIDDEHVGETIAVVGDELVAYGGCAALPCRIVARNLATGHVRVLAERAGLASVVRGVLAYEDYRHRGRIVITHLAGGDARTVALGAGMRLVPAESRALAGVESADGFIAIGPGGRPSVSRTPVSFVQPAAETQR